MSFLLINYEYPPLGAGAANATYYIAQSLKKNHAKVVVLTSSYKNLVGRKSEDGITIYRRLSLRRKKNSSNIIEMISFLLSALTGMPAIVKKEKITKIIIFFSIPCGPIGLFAKFFFKIPYCISLRGGDVPGTEKRLRPFYWLTTPLRRVSMRHAIACVANSPGLKMLSEKADPISVKVIPNGVDSEYFCPVFNKRDQLTFLFAGRFQVQKNIFSLISAFAEVKNRSEKGIRLDLVGAGPMKPDLIEYAKSLDLYHEIAWHPWLNKKTLLSLYQECHCFVNPSFYEGMPNTVLEAMACGLAIIASDCPGNAMLVQHKKTGLLFNLQEHQSLVAALSFYVDNIELTVEHGEAGRKMAVSKYSWASTSALYYSLFEKD